MGLLSLAGALLTIAGVVCWIIILIQAFQDEVWKGCVSIICFLYWIYYAIFEFEHEHKWLIVVLALVGDSAGGALIAAGRGH